MKCSRRIRAIASTVSIPPTTCSNQSKQRIRPDCRGSILDADTPHQGVKIARRMTGPAVAGSDAAQELGLSRVARTHCGWIDAASVHRLLLRAGAETRRLSARLHPSDTTDAESGQ